MVGELIYKLKRSWLHSGSWQRARFQLGSSRPFSCWPISSQIKHWTDKLASGKLVACWAAEQRFCLHVSQEMAGLSQPPVMLFTLSGFVICFFSLWCSTSGYFDSQVLVEDFFLMSYRLYYDIVSYPQKRGKCTVAAHTKKKQTPSSNLKCGWCKKKSIKTLVQTQFAGYQRMISSNLNEILVSRPRKLSFYF